MNNYLASSVPALANHLWQSTAFAAAAWLLTFLLRKNSARVRYGIWLAASIKFLIPFALLIAVGGLLPKPKQFVAPTVYTAMKVTEQPFADISSTFATPVAQTPTLTQRIAADIPAVLVALWLAGAVGVLIVWWARWRKASICLHDAVPALHGRELEILRSLEARLSSRIRSPLRLRLSPEPTEPSIYGILRPVLVWPERLSEQMSDEHMEAIMAHELAHARRFDNATAALHMLVEAVFWFHPLVWWMERRMIEERERACDETVVALGGSPDAYAEGILKTCRFCVGSALPCVAGVTGADLKKRVVDIMTARMLLQMTWPKKMLLGAAVLCVVAAPVLLGQLQTSADWEKAAGGKMTFDVASVKRNTSGVSPSNRPTSNVPLDAQNLYPRTGGLFSATNFPLLEYMRFAYKLTPEQSKGLQSQVPWANTNRYDIQGRASGNPTQDQMRLMMQALLADRFKLALHFESRQLPVFALVLERPGKFGPQLRPHVDDPPCSAAPPSFAFPAGEAAGLQATVAGGFPEMCGAFLPLQPSAPGRFRAGARDVSIAVIAMLFGSPLTGVDRPVLDSTGLTGNFDLIIEFTRQPNRPPPPDATSQPADTGPTFLEALKDQLGLKLESTTGPVDTLVIDHIEEPSPN